MHTLSLIYTTLTMATSRLLSHQFATFNHGAVYDFQHEALGYPHKPRVCLHVCSVMECSNTGHPHQFLSACTSTRKTPTTKRASLDMGGTHRWGAWEKTLVRHSKWCGCGSPPGCPNVHIPKPLRATTPMSCRQNHMPCGPMREQCGTQLCLAWRCTTSFKVS